MCPDGTTPLDSDNDGYTIVSVGSNGSTQSAYDALVSYLGTGLEICDDDYLKLISLCPLGSGYIMSFTMEVMFISKVTITFTTSAADIVEVVSKRTPPYARTPNGSYTRAYL